MRLYHGGVRVGTHNGLCTVRNKEGQIVVCKKVVQRSLFILVNSNSVTANTMNVQNIVQLQQASPTFANRFVITIKRLKKLKK